MDPGSEVDSVCEEEVSEGEGRGVRSVDALEGVSKVEVETLVPSVGVVREEEEV